MRHPLRRLTSHLLCAAFAALALLPGAASAQTATLPSCMPLVYGVPAYTPRHESGAVGQHVFWACRERDQRVTWHGFSCLRAECHTAMLNAAVHQITTTTGSRTTTATEQWRRFVGYDCTTVLREWSNRGNLCRERAALLAAKRAEWSR